MNIHVPQKIGVLAFILIILVGIMAPAVQIEAEDFSQKPATYRLLEPLPGMESPNFDVREESGAFGAYINLIIKLVIGICAVLAVVMIVVGGFQYMTSELISSKEEGKERIRNALFGLLLALGTFLILQEINPNLLNINPKLGDADVTVTIEEVEQVINFNNGGRFSGGGGALPKEITDTICDSKYIEEIARVAGDEYKITPQEAKVFACLAASESSCGQNARDSGTGAYGVLQVLLDTHRDCFNNNRVCKAIVGGNVGCPRGPNCKIAAGEVPCNVTAAICVLRKPPRSFQPWTTDPRGAVRQKRCITANGLRY